MIWLGMALVIVLAGMMEVGAKLSVSRYRREAGSWRRRERLSRLRPPRAILLEEIRSPAGLEDPGGSKEELVLDSFGALTNLDKPVKTRRGGRKARSSFYRFRLL